MNKVPTTSALLAALLLIVLSCGGGNDDKAGGSGAAGDDPLPTFPEQPSEEAEKKKIDETVEKLQTALQAQDVEASVALFVPEVQQQMQQWFEANQNVMPDLAGPLTGSPLSALSEEQGWGAEVDRRRSAEIAVSFDGKTYYVGLEKIDGRWLIRTF